MLNPIELENDLFKALKDQSNNTDENQSPEEAMRAIAKKWATAFDKYVKSGIVTTNGSASTQTGKMK